MTSVPPSIAAETAITRQNVTLSVIKQNADQEQRLVELLEEQERSAPVNNARGTNIDIQV